MNKLTKHQRHYRKRKKESKRDFKTVQRDDGKTGVQVTKKQLCVRVNEEAAERLREEAKERQITQQDMLSWMILKGLPNQSQGARGTGTAGYAWPANLMNSEDVSKKNKGSTGVKQLNLAITSTAWNKLHCFSNSIGLSKARIVQDLIIHYRFCSPENLEKQKQYKENRSNSDDSYPKTPPTKEAIEAFHREFEKLMKRDQERLDQLLEVEKESYEGRLSESSEDDS